MPSRNPAFNRGFPAAGNSQYGGWGGGPPPTDGGGAPPGRPPPAPAPRPPPPRRGGGARGTKGSGGGHSDIPFTSGVGCLRGCGRHMGPSSANAGNTLGIGTSNLCRLRGAAPVLGTSSRWDALPMF